MKAVLVTGGAGFIGSNFVPYFVEKYPDYRIINLDKLTYAGNLDNLKECEDKVNYQFVQGDICDAELVKKLFVENDIRGVVHFAAESHVDNSISGPRAFIETNLLGTFTLLDAARNHWMEAPHKAVILGDMRELGKDSLDEHRKIVDYLQTCGFEQVFLVGDQFGAIPSPYAVYPDAPALIARLQAQKPTGMTLLIKGSNGIHLNTVVDYL